jgi:hypothetical protein
MSLQTAGTAKWFLGMRENLSSNNYIIYSEQIATDVLKLDVSTGAATFSSSVLSTASSAVSFAFAFSGASYAQLFQSTSTGYSLGYGASATTIGTPVLTWTSGGNVGIGTTSPATYGTTNLEVNGKTGGSYIVVKGSSDSVIGELASDGAIYISSKTAHPMIFRTTDIERMRITSGGNVGIGTSPIGSNKLTVLMNDATNATGIAIKAVNDGASASQPALSYFNGSGNLIAKIYADNGTGYLGFNIGSSDIERMRITSAGNTQPGTDNAYSLGVSGTRWSAVWAANGTIQTSDEREKKDIVESDLGLDFVSKLRPVSFKWKIGKNEVTTQIVKDEEGNPILDDEGNEKTELVITPIEGKRTHYGLIAQEVEELLDGKDFGGFIHDDKTDIKGLRYDQFVPLLIKSIQEQTQIIKDLEARIVSLESK